ncbi:cysteine desulfurase [Candidatus Woesearchaeota archaeon]|nr:cysteine desulfurase [Candidatus Woesearchaeota archaeon]
MKKIIYLDNGATTMAAPEVVQVMNKYHSEKYGNASSLHRLGREASMAIDDARRTIAKSIGAKETEIIFTSGGTESNNFAIKGIAFANKGKGKHIITTKIEHDCVLNSCKWLKEEGFEVTYLNVDKEGFVNPDDLDKAIRKDTVLVTVIHGNNEIGTIQDLEKLYAICKKHNVYFHTDACQSYTKTEVSAKHADLITLNAHKIHGPKGVGVLYIKKGTKITPVAHGGGHEFSLRSGTENVPGIVGFAKAVQLAMDRKHVAYMAKLRDRLTEGLLEVPGTILNGPRGGKRLCNNVNISFKYIEGEAIGTHLDSEGICSSTGSACSSKSLEPSHVLMAIGMKPEDAHGSLRLTLSRYTTEDEIDKALEVLPNVVEKLRKISPLTRVIKRVL